MRKQLCRIYQIFEKIVMKVYLKYLYDNLKHRCFSCLILFHKKVKVEMNLIYQKGY